MNLFQLTAVAVIATALVLIVKQQKPELALLLAAAAGIFILLAVMPMLQSIIYTVKNIAARAGLDSMYLEVALKATGVAYITSLGSELCRDAGQGAIAAKLDLGGKIIIAALALPVINALFNLASGILGS